ncbi:HNH endonuclease family protein [Cupriavidus plantarum]|uniref:HNH endonuclease family protein n=1 Tax=Cupriavidus plantarum TaxID=942865 RepID=UPI001FCFCC25|nr:DUF262 domain-containing protein [Cupriavidus plantarum]
MIRRADFALQDDDTEQQSFDQIQGISLSNLAPGSLLLSSLRKPDFQRETNHWSPEQVVSLLECFINGELIPSVILWRSPMHLYVIDGGHRLSVLRAWIEDDYGDGPISQEYFGYSISDVQRRIAKQTRELVAEKIGTWAHYTRGGTSGVASEAHLRRINTMATRALPVQWVQGNADKAENSFFRINMKGTPLDDIEELLLSNRRKPIPIAARAVIRAGMGHKYWSAFPADTASLIELYAHSLHATLFEPELRSPVKTLDLPLGGSTGVRAALQVLIDFMLVASRNQQGSPKTVGELDDDIDGTATQGVLERALRLASRITGNEHGSLGLHPAIYFYGPTGRHHVPLFMGTAELFARALTNNDQSFFPKFTRVRQTLEETLMLHKDLIAQVLQKTVSWGRATLYMNVLDQIINAIAGGESVGEAEIVRFAGRVGKIFIGDAKTKAAGFSDDTKSAIFLRAALQGAIKCPICHGYLDSNKSVSYDHKLRRAQGGLGDADNGQLTHPYCNQSVKG